MVFSKVCHQLVLSYLMCILQILNIIQNTGNNVDFIAVSKNIRCKVLHHSPARFNIYIIPEYIYKLSPAGISSEKLSSQVQFTLRLVLLRKVSSEKLSSQIQFCLRLVLLRKLESCHVPEAG